MVLPIALLCLLPLVLSGFAAAGWADHSRHGKTAGCGRDLPGGVELGKSINVTIISDNIQRQFLLNVPITYNRDSPAGLIFSFHGRGGNSTTQEVLTQFSNPEFNDKYLAVYPQGVDDQWQGDPEATTDDVAFTLHMLEKLSDDFCLDEFRIFASGKSNGGGFSLSVLACDPVASTRIAAFAAAAGAYYQKNTTDVCDPETIPISCNAGRPGIPILEFHGGADTTIPYAGGARREECLPSVPHFITSWAERDGMSSRNRSVSIYDGNVTKYMFGRRRKETRLVTSYFIPTMDHVWPSTEPNPDSIAHNAPPTYFNATPIMMDFFGNNTLPWKF
ncbi:carbohydrate esterase family 1 protein [Polychaeton citri CBS 116435]|uniref:feruloyl esterase n=1 Tax=Polychaeton citri CBS 116435 TaxID=1314669 RepID=A0A9P4UPU7_9PEZI|nr:carbohydrate esterase family 1 protein [Polychaeton citri CBS 116435]